MKCRQMINGNIVWFGSIGKDEQGNAIFVEDKKSYVSNQDAIANSLTEKLNVLQNELWYNINYGIPLFNKYKSKAIIDAYITNEILSQKGVKNIITFTSTFVKHSYSCYAKINTVYGVLEVQI